MSEKQAMIQDEICDAIIASVSKLARQCHSDKISVRDVLKDMGITNRVFYNRFHNIDEVLEILYQDMIKKVRQSLAMPWQEGTDFLAHVRKVAAQTMILSYEYKDNLSLFVFETDASSGANYAWWNQEIIKLITIGQEQGVLKKDLDREAISYAVWCFIRGFNADAMARNLSRDEALLRFDYGFSVFLDGMCAHGHQAE